MSNTEIPANSPPDWMSDRAVGVLLHPTSLPSQFGIGTLDDEAIAFLDFLSEAGFKYWQVCPLGPTGFGDSPYQCFSSFAGNPYLIDLLALSRAGLISQDILGPLLFLNSERTDYGSVHQLKWPILFQAHENYRQDPKHGQPYGDFAEFRKQHAGWLHGYSLFSALKFHFSHQPWWEWPEELRTFAAAQKSPLAKRLSVQTEAFEFIQYLFYGQWALLRQAATKRGIAIIGDIPIFAALDSADIWSAPHLFKLQAGTGRPLAVAGCPPDYFSKDGQLWGNPLHDWQAQATDGYAWWISRLRTNLDLCDVVRIDHFRGFESYWSIPAGSATARPGRWVKGPGMDFFQAVFAALPGAKLIAEDLGVLTPDVLALRDATGLPGMAVLQFAFGGDAKNFYLPHNHRANCVIYTGTHDNDTSTGWYAAADERTRDHVRRYLRVGDDDMAWNLIRAAYGSVCNLAIIPMQDLFALDSKARLNTPGRSEGNWQWRYRASQLKQLREDSAGYLRQLAELYGRNPPIRRS